VSDREVGPRTYGEHTNVRRTERGSVSGGSGGVQVDLYGVKLSVTPAPDTNEEPDTWREVAQVLNRQLMAIVTNTITLAADVLRAARSLVRGIGAVPTRLARRVGEAHARADIAETQRRVRVEWTDPPPPDDARRRLDDFISEKRVEGVNAEVFVDPVTNHIVLCMLPTTDKMQLEDLAAAAVLTAVRYDDRIKEPPPTYPSSMNVERVKEVLKSLGDRDTALLRAMFVDERSKDEVCREFDVDQDYLRVLLHRARERFQAAFTRKR
jgi:DNA-directed RNA polymerase specialized sigma24 family protein